MLKLQNVCKTYVTKSKVETHALQDVNLEIAERGMVFILGKSGSGKSTLLNLLGGLDSPTSGEIFVDGVSMQKFSPRDYAEYRNNYVGFVFQEFNLLADFNVRDNVALALKLNRVENEDEKIAAALKQVELDDTYLSRRIGEMSGGEKQRIAIARALIKDSKLILADEPTGNLDSATSESIWNILKTLSKERLVVVVSHDRESAEKYADRTIEIADGKVVSDIGAQSAVSERVATDDSASDKAVKSDVSETAKPKANAGSAKPASSGMSFATRLKMGFNNLRLRKFKTVSVVVISFLCTLTILLTQMCLSHSANVTLAHYIQQEGVDHFTIRSDFVTSDKKEYLDENCRYLTGHIVESKQDILDVGLTFVGEALELDDSSYYATSALVNFYYENGQGKVKVDGRYVTMNKNGHPFEFLIGKEVVLSRQFQPSKEAVLAGIIDAEGLTTQYEISTQYFYNKNFDVFENNDYSTGINSRKEEFVLHLGDATCGGNMMVRDYAQSGRLVDSGFNVIVTADGLWAEVEDVTLAENEIVLPYEMYAQLFNAEPAEYYTDKTDLFNIPKEIGQTLSLKFDECGTGANFADYGEVKLVGVCFSKRPDDQHSIFVNHFIQRQVARDFGFSSGTVLIQTSSVKNLSGFLKTLRKNYDCEVRYAGSFEPLKGAPRPDGDVADAIYRLELGVFEMSIVLSILGVILLILLVLLVINLISFSVTNRKREIGILSALGASNGDITSIFLLETAIISAIVFVFALALSFVFPAVMNPILSKQEYLPFTVSALNVDMLTVAISIVASFGLMLLAALIPLRKIIKLKPIDAIRNN